MNTRPVFRIRITTQMIQSTSLNTSRYTGIRFEYVDKIKYKYIVLIITNKIWTSEYKG